MTIAYERTVSRKAEERKLKAGYNLCTALLSRGTVPDLMQLEPVRACDILPSKEVDPRVGKGVSD